MCQTMYSYTQFLLSTAVVKLLPSFLVSFIQSQTAFNEGWKGGLLGTDSKQEHSWDMFKIGQTALHSKVYIFC